MAATIGLKIANGEFYSILEENSSIKKRLILTTVHDKQHSVQIDLYRSYSKTMADALYIGSLVVENIKLKPKGGPSVELTISSNYDGNINADAIDMDPKAGREHHYLNVSLKSLEEDNQNYEIHDFELEDTPPMGLYEKAQAKQGKKSRFPWLIILCAVIILLLLCFSFWYFCLSKNTSTTRIISGTSLAWEITRFNNIHNPDPIFSGTSIRVPPRN